MTQDSQAARGPLIERRSIDFIPETERHGKLYSQFTLWMGANLQITAIITGALAVVLGGDVFWSLIGLFVGQVFGGAVMALHAAQGPKLGLPQMISSRVQFGVYGAAIPIVLVCLMYLGFTATGTVLSGQALGQLFGVSDTAGILIFAAVIAGVTLFGYRMIHIIGRIATVLGIIAFFYLFSRVIALGDVGQLLQIRHFTWSSFLLSVSLAASWQIAVALIGQHSFLNAFKSFILFLLAFFVPWSAVNLVDYYFVSREQYDVEALSDPNGRYGRWNWPGILIYLFGVLVQMPFISTKLYTGPMVERLGGVDISWIIGLVVPSILYYLFARRDAVPQPRGAARATHTL